MKPISVKECGRLPHLYPLVVAPPLTPRFFSPPSRRFVHLRPCPCKPPRARPPPSPSPRRLPSPSALFFVRSWEIEYLCKLNEGGRDGRRQISQGGMSRGGEEGPDNHMVRVNLGNNQEGRSNLARNFVGAAEKRIALVN